MNIFKSWVNRLKKGHMLSVIGIFLLIIIVLGVILYQSRTQAKQTSENSYNMAFYELVDYVGNVETYLAKAIISSTPEHGAETLTHLWREANMAQTYLSRLPIETQELENTQMFELFQKDENEILIIHGDQDDTAPIEDSYAFQAKYQTEMEVVKGADHRFKKEGELEEVIAYAEQFYEN